MTDPAYVQLPSDSTDNKNKVRSFSIVDSEGNTVLEQVSVIADDWGNVVGVANGGRLSTLDDETALLLRGVLKRLDLMAAALDKRYEPPDDLGY